MSDNIELLQEPVAFEEFQFTLGTDFDIPDESLLLLPPPEECTFILDEQDQQMFTQFLDQFYNDSLCDPKIEETRLCEAFFLHSLQEPFEENPEQEILLETCSRTVDINTTTNTNHCEAILL
ncbi:unnamed protein product [Rhizopus stolonifer]